MAMRNIRNILAGMDGVMVAGVMVAGIRFTDGPDAMAPGTL